MSNRSKSLFRGPNVKHFTLVHRSQRDPLLNDPEASDRVLAEVSKGKGRTRSDLESVLGEEKLSSVRRNEGEVASYGVYFDDSEYDYMQHLRGVGEDGDGLGTLVEAPRKNESKGKGKAMISLKEQEDAREHEQSYRDYLESTVEEEGLRPDMDPNLREVLEALEDDAYVDDGDDGNQDFDGSEQGDFLDQFLQGKASLEYRDPIASGPAAGLDPSSTFATQVARYKPSAGDSDDDFEDEEEDDLASEGGDTVADLKAASARRPPRRAESDRRSLASGSAFSMSSSSMFRNDGLRTLDDRFDQMEALYEDDSDEDDEEPDELPSSVQDLMDDFLTSYEIHGGKFTEVPGGAGTTPADQLTMLRSGVEKMEILEAYKRQQREEVSRKKRQEGKEDIWFEEAASSRRNNKDKWDCETILSTYSNLENHPKILRANNSLEKSKKVKGGDTLNKITIDPRTGFPVLAASDRGAQAPSDRNGEEEEGEDAGDDSDATMDAEDMNGSKRQTVTRARDETPAEKKARKSAVKEDRQNRRAEKKSTKETFGQERKRQQRLKSGKLRDAADVAKGNTRGIEVMRLS